MYPRKYPQTKTDKCNRSPEYVMEIFLPMQKRISENDEKQDDIDSDIQKEKIHALIESLFDFFHRESRMRTVKK